MKKVLLFLILSVLIAGSGTAQNILTHTTSTMTAASIYDNSYIGHNFDATTGQGIKYGGPDAMFTSGFIAGYSVTKMVGLMGSFVGGTPQVPLMNDWLTTTPFSGFTTNSNFDQVATATFNDNNAPSANKIGLTVTQTSMSKTSENFVILQYNITNNSGAQISGLYAGIFADWDVGVANFANDRGGYDVARGLNYEYENGGVVDSRYYGFTALTGMGGAMVTSTSAFSPTNEVRDSCFMWMKSTTYAPITANGDMRSWISSGPYTVPAGSTVTVAFAIIAGANLAALQANADLAKAKWLSITPVELTSFTATANNNTVTLNWATATEMNNRGFEIQRKSANSDYVNVGFVNGNGSSSESHNYTFTEAVQPGTYTYRLRQIDFNGRSEFSNAVEVEYNPSSYTMSQNYPNPFNPSTKISFSVAKSGMVKLAVYNLLGQQVQTLVNEVKEAGTYDVSFNASNLTSGVYFYKLETPEFSKTMKMILNK